MKKTFQKVAVVAVTGLLVLGFGSPAQAITKQGTQYCGSGQGALVTSTSPVAGNVSHVHVDGRTAVTAIFRSNKKTFQSHGPYSVTAWTATNSQASISAYSSCQY